MERFALLLLFRLGLLWLRLDEHAVDAFLFHSVGFEMLHVVVLGVVEVDAIGGSFTDVSLAILLDIFWGEVLFELLLRLALDIIVI